MYNISVFLPFENSNPSESVTQLGDEISPWTSLHQNSYSEAISHASPLATFLYELGNQKLHYIVQPSW